MKIKTTEIWSYTVYTSDIAISLLHLIAASDDFLILKNQQNLQ